MSPPTLMSEVPADHQGLGRAIPSFLRTKCAIKPVLCLLFSKKKRVRHDLATEQQLFKKVFLLKYSKFSMKIKMQNINDST